MILLPEAHRSQWVSLVTTGINAEPLVERNVPSGILTKVLRHKLMHDIRKKRKFELARPPAMTKLAPQRIHTLRTRGGNKKYRALRFVAMQFMKPVSKCI